MNYRWCIKNITIRFFCNCKSFLGNLCKVNDKSGAVRQLLIFNDDVEPDWQKCLEGDVI